MDKSLEQEITSNNKEDLNKFIPLLNQQIQKIKTNDVLKLFVIKILLLTIEHDKDIYTEYIIQENKAYLDIFTEYKGMSIIKKICDTKKSNIIEIIVKQNIVINKEQLNRNLISAVENNNKRLAFYCIRLGADDVDKALYIAIVKEFIKMIIILKDDANVDNIKDSLLYKAINFKNVDLVYLLTIMNVKMIHAAVVNDNFGMLLYSLNEMLKKRNLEEIINEKDDDDHTPLALALKKENIKMIKFLIDKGTNIYDDIGNIYIATNFKNLEIVDLLIDKGINMVRIAVVNNNLDLVTLLLDKTTKKTGKTIKEIIDEKYVGRSVFFVVGGVPVFFVEGDTCLHSVVRGEGSIFREKQISEVQMKTIYKSVKFLIDKGANLDFKIFKLVIQRGFLDILKLLFEKKKLPIDTHDDDHEDKLTLLQISVVYDQQEIFTYLLTLGADINKKNVNGISALHLAIFTNNIEFVKLLIKEGAIIDKKCLQYAKEDEEAREEIVDVFVQAENFERLVKENQKKTKTKTKTKPTIKSTKLEEKMIEESHDEKKSTIVNLLTDDEEKKLNSIPEPSKILEPEYECGVVSKCSEYLCGTLAITCFLKKDDKFVEVLGAHGLWEKPTLQYIDKEGKLQNFKKPIIVPIGDQSFDTKFFAYENNKVSMPCISSDSDLDFISHEWEKHGKNFDNYSNYKEYFVEVCRLSKPILNLLFFKKYTELKKGIECDFDDYKQVIEKSKFSKYLKKINSGLTGTRTVKEFHFSVSKIDGFWKFCETDENYYLEDGKKKYKSLVKKKKSMRKTKLSKKKKSMRKKTLKKEKSLKKKKSLKKHKKGIKLSTI
jgi:ankyrin repeat protein